ncbi:pentapeptide repeat-containing protein [Phormidium pseudopriestleyi FRX01]|uniref:Pentapeptide repeat-containing protein n=1 Tax=Phormidium pseudopriestleyi FRX01 TaxID=1759528 RepID=A0ABS3FX02_9CYAN|nr:pentapeptide repeat-containing protein [Phormidium pseudopriestleyi]MBO0351519.1 pentapeptide repeat-containing protein [Phormidium pseudopriestleyi FRX01]
MNPTLSLTPSELLTRYQAGERNFAGIRLIEPNNDPEALCGADLSGIILSGAYLPGVKLREANLTGAKMVGVYMPDADLTLADLRKVNLIGATLKRACLECADLSRTLLEGANLIGANLDGSDTAHANLEYSVLCQTNLSKIWPSHPSFDIYSPGSLLWETTMPDGTFIAIPQYDQRF